MKVGRDLTVHYSVVQPSPRPVVTSTLRRDVASFVGRDTELQRIVDAAGPGQVVSIHTIDGMPGVGKTALVTRAAHELATEFPDGRYFVELHAHTPGQTAADPADVLARLLTGLGVDPRSLPATLEGRRDLWLDRVNGKRILLVLDDARDHAQVEPLLPAGGGCLTLVTSRRRLVALDGAVAVPLDVLAPDAAVELFLALAHRTPTETDSIAVAEVVRRCGFLPLAIVLLAGRWAQRPAWTIAMLAGEFAATADRLGELEAGPRAVRVAFTMSYQDLPPQRQRLFRCLGLHPGSDTDMHTAAALAGVPVAAAQTELEALYTDHLVEETQPGRYRQHDLLRTYARTLADTDLTDTNRRAVDRLLDYYQATAAAADRHLARRTRPTARPSTHTVTSLPDAAVPEFRDEMQALAWMRTERANLLACLKHTTTSQPSRSIGLADILAGLLERDGPWPQASDLHQRALDTAHHLGADHLSEANTLTNLGIMRQLTGNFADAADLHRQALALYRELGNRLGQANALGNLGIVHQRTGDHTDAADLQQQALGLYRELGDRLGQAGALDHLGLVRRLTGDYADAADLHQQALALYRELGNRRGQADTLTNLGLVHMWTGNHAEAASLHRQAVALFRELGNRLGQANTLGNLGVVHQLTGDYAEAADLQQQALTLFRELGNRLGQANTLGNLAVVRRSAGAYADATDLLGQALPLFRELGDRRGEAETLNEVGQLLLETGERRDALLQFTDALALARTIRNQLEQARALEGAARCRVGLDDTATAITELREAVEIYQRIDAPQTGPAAEYLATLTPDPPPH
ncbi:ATP-binding protein [Nocardia wallacei]|uniref:ATP-binding protein n=1 Tax=Nocardia wallacei TaxID=480035 RepID=UPI0024548545|nr:tetratricopeptide repeat protein [Nocardia wallacei]